MVRCIEIAESRLQAVLEQVERVRDSDFTFSEGPEALVLIGKKLNEHLSEVRELRRISDFRIIEAECHKALEAVSNVLPILGIILRSTHIRNAFEVYGPIRQIARRLIWNDKLAKTSPRLIWSSGWDYIPMTFRKIGYLPGFVIITIPAPESANPLLLPLAGHELGHRVWTDEGLGPIYTPECRSQIAKFISETQVQMPGLSKEVMGWTQERLEKHLKTVRHSEFEVCLANTTRQVEELFCDLIGYFLFGESFLHAFAYLLAPKPPGERHASYPPIRVRAQQLQLASEAFKERISDSYTIPPKYIDQFSNDAFSDPWMRAADFAAAKICSRLIQEVINLSSRTNWKDLPCLSTELRQKIRLESFHWGVPAAGSESLGNILNAAWDADGDESFWSEFYPLQLQPESERIKFKRDALREVVLKNIEVFEYESLQES